MRTRLAVPVVVLAFATGLAACGGIPATAGLAAPSAGSSTHGGPTVTGGSAPGGSASDVDFGADFFTGPAVPLDLIVAADASAAATTHITSAGGSVKALGADGTAFELQIPPDALIDEVDVTLTPVASITGWPVEPGSIAAVVMEPDGLTFVIPAQLVITPAQPIGDSVGMGLTFNSAGTDAGLQLAAVTDDTVRVTVDHFSGSGFTWNTSVPFWLAMERYRQSQVEARLNSRIAAQLAVAREQQQAGHGADPSISEILEGVRAEWERDVLNARLLRASASCHDAQYALIGFIYWERVVQSMQRPDLAIKPPPRLFNLVRYVCAEEATKLCFESGDIHRLVVILLSDQRSLEFMAQGSTGDTNPYVDACARYDLKITHKSKIVMAGASPVGGGDMTMEGEIAATIKLRWEFLFPDLPAGELKGDADGALTSGKGSAKAAGATCPITLSPSGSVAPYQASEVRVQFINTGPERTTIRLKDVDLKLTEGHVRAKGSIDCFGVKAPINDLDMPFVFWDGPAVSLAGWTAEDHPKIATKTFERKMTVDVVGDESIELELIHTPGEMPKRPPDS